MGKPAPAPPPVPDPNTIANAQTQSSEQTAQYQSQINNANQSSPFGTVQYTQPGGPGTPYTETTTLSPQEQAIFNQATANQAQAAGIAGSQLNNVAASLANPIQPESGLATGVPTGGIQSAFNPGPNPITAYGSGGGINNQYGFNGQVQNQVSGASDPAAIQAAQNAAYQSQAQYLNPQWQQAGEHEQAQLAAQGLNPNDAAYQNAEQIFGGQQNQAYQGAQNAATLAGEQEQNTLFGQNVAAGQFANTAQAQGTGENAALAAYANQAQNQAFGQNTSMADFYNTAGGQIYGQNQGQGTFANQAQAQGNTEAMANANLANAAAGQTFNSQLAAQQEQINAYTALANSAQVQAPTSTPAQTQVAPTNVADAYQISQNAAQANYNAQQQNYQSGLNGLYTLGAAALLA